MKKLFYTTVCLFFLASLLSACGARDQCPGVSQANPDSTELNG